ncbi:hypothetical protein [Hyphococcus luteus]|uniref:hypothetical protein n=1 Tax=Hyphococcus luteus TaxID=2058213 RepID=UPI000CF2079B|nr:hypothetical protein [Marinicaulis flavus]
MKICRSRAGAALIAAVIAFLASQTLIDAHAAKYGDGPHKHDGQVCVLSLVAHHDGKAIGTSAFVLAVFVAVWRAGAPVAQTERAAIAVRAAHARGPPRF